MAYDPQFKVPVLVFELENRQEAYARCLGAIKHLENSVLNGGENLDRFFSGIQSAKAEGYLEFQVNQYRPESTFGSRDKMEFPSDKDKQEYARIPLPLEKDQENFLVSAINNWRKEKKEEDRPLYHIRIKFEYDTDYKNLDNLQYLAMLMQQAYYICFDQGTVVPNKLQKRLTVFVIPHYEGKSYQFGGQIPNPDTTLFSLASQYLCLIAKMHNGVISGLSLPGEVDALNFKIKHRMKNSAFFPLLYLKENSDNYRRIFEKAGMKDPDTDPEANDKPSIMKKGFTYKVDENNPRPFNDANNDDPHKAIADLMLNEARAKLFGYFATLSAKYTHDMTQGEIFALGREAIEKYVNDIDIYARRYDRFIFVLFSYLFSVGTKDESDIKKAIEDTMRLARELGDGIRQIVQNSLQHSQYHECYISFGKVKGLSPEGKIEEHLQVRVTDLNTNETITQRFTEILKKEKTEEGEIKYDKYFVKKGITEIRLKELVGVFDANTGDGEKAMSAWYGYREQDASAHIGLSMFYNALQRCQCRNLSIISGTKHEQKASDEFSCDKNLSLPMHIIPGTQISFSIPGTRFISSSPVNLVQLVNNDAFREDYDAFAHYLKYNVSEEAWKEQKSVLDDASLYELKSTDAEQKIVAQNRWTKFWKEFLASILEVPNTHQTIHFCNVNHTKKLVAYLNERDNCEVFLKGFFAAASLFRIKDDPSERTPSCIYFENLPADFVVIFQEISTSLSVMGFSQNLQAFLSCIRDGNNSHPAQLLALGNCVGHVIQNAYIMSLEHGEDGIEPFYYQCASEILQTYKNMLKKKLKPLYKQYVCPFTVFEQPLDPEWASGNYGLPQYFQQIMAIADKPLISTDKNNRGYKIDDIHMRLGNKVHTDSFYELSYIFYRTSVANRTAFYILRNILDEIEKVLVNENLVFYGYASYSQAMVVSLREILKKYLSKGKNKEKAKNVHYAIYQFNLKAESSRDKLQVYSTLVLDETAVEEKNIKTSVVQIVPIGSTLTTFDKMRTSYIEDREKKENRKIYEESSILTNYNVFLAHDKSDKKPIVQMELLDVAGNDSKKDGDEPSAIEKELWKEIDKKKRVITINTDKLRALSGEGDAPKSSKISYIIEKTSRWVSPIDCTDCFPLGKVNKEKPLVETDQTSTVPYLQLYQKKDKPKETEAADNVERLKKLYGCVYYGHFIRGKNHFQYYIDTQKYLQEAETLLISWLENERNEENKKIGGDDEYITPVLNVIFSPEHNTNVGFSQLINAHFFNGTAEIVAVNVDKQFRTNFVCEHDALRQTIERLFKDDESKISRKDENKNSGKDRDRDKNRDLPVRFYFADDTIISGSSYRRANDLLLSLIPKKYRHNYEAAVFYKSFILIDRLSSNTHVSYINNPEHNFLSFCKIHISNMRTQGDSCVGCKIESEAMLLFKRSSTRSFVNYWKRKKQDYSHHVFDEICGITEYDNGKAFARMILTHVIENSIRGIKSNSFKMGEKIKGLIDIILAESENTTPPVGDGNRILVHDVFVRLLNAKENSQEEKQTEERVKIYLLDHVIKILTRPFLIYNLEKRKFLLPFVIDICESILDDKTQGEYPPTIKNIKAILKNADEGIVLLDFIKNCLFESLANMNSTYLLRKETIRKVYAFIKNYDDLASNEHCANFTACRNTTVVPGKENEKYQLCNENYLRCFWRSYAFNIHKVVDAGGDETRSLWMEYLLTHGNEYSTSDKDKENSRKGIAMPLYESIIETKDDKKDRQLLFEEFCMEIFIQNTRLLFDGIDKTLGKEKSMLNDDNSYFFNNMQKMRDWDFEWAIAPNLISKRITGAERKVFEFVKSNNEKNTDIKYKNFISAIVHMVRVKYAIRFDSKEDNLCIALVTQSGSNNSNNMDDLEFVEVNIRDKYSPEENARTKFIIKQRIIWAINKGSFKEMPPKNIYENSRLMDDGYFLTFPHVGEEQAEIKYDGEKKTEFDFNYDLTHYKKPFFILRFDNIPLGDNPPLDLGRGAQPIDNVYLYMSFSFKNGQKNKEKVVPLLVLRDILSYRNRIMGMLERDFSSHLMQVDAHKTGEVTVLKHEKTVVHESIHDRPPECLWKVGEESLELWKYDWLLFKNYINIQIAKLFTRTLLQGDEEKLKKDKNEKEDKGKKKGIYKLYLTDEDYVEETMENNGANFELPAKKFINDLFNKEADRRICLLHEIIDFSYDDSLKNADMVSQANSRVKGYFNQEYMKCILYDIFLTCAKYWVPEAPFLVQVENLKETMRKHKSNSGVVDNRAELGTNSNEEVCRVFLLRKDNNVVIINPISKDEDMNKEKIKEKNENINILLKNSIDSFSGHMSLFTCYKYISGNFIGENGKELPAPSFRYCKFVDLDSEWKDFIKKKWPVPPGDDPLDKKESLFFVSNLPILKECKL